MKNIFSFTASFLALQVANAVPNRAPTWLETQIAEFERGFSNGLGYELNNTIRLIGYKTIKIPPGKANIEFKKHYDNEIVKNRDAYPNHLFDHHSGDLRVYFPVQSALINHGDSVTEANHLGELPYDKVHGDCAVMGRKQTAQVTGVEGNTIKDGVIYLAEAVRPVRKHDLVYVYDMGHKSLIGHDHHALEKRGGKKSCINNHGGPNCSDKFKIHKGRCKFNKKVCMDYNGWATNCKNSGWRRYLNFPGSDCDYALGRGKCWNEVM
ncbi:hypothetical protein AJ80_02437 [Polytolypa hystricis UAMH7299]|uniref:Uncharacterized protein n=1 Tax=Polytolypa hystricis (strain UAMH7299) TaxID=1447883 RepID=A0A2B7YR58_POLH7|nr:hypothetical protein AJ80_02437 [Polytolypa hystricis UAMH7299]